MTSLRFPLIAMAGAICSAIAIAPAAAAEIQIASQGPIVELSVTEQVKAVPDTATIGGGVTTRAATAVEAMRQNAAAMTKVIDRLRAGGVDRKDIQTSAINLNAQYQYNNDNQPPRFLGYDASNQVTVVLHDMAKVGPTLDALVVAGANNVFGPSFSLEADAAAKAQARRTAWQRAESQAREYAQMAGYKGVKLLAVIEGMIGGGPRPMSGDIVLTSARMEKTPVEPGQVGTGVTLTVKYEMTR